MRQFVLDRMYRRVSWFMPADPVILDFLYIGERRIIQSPSCIEKNVPYKIGHVRGRLAELVERGLVEKTGWGYYRLTELGEALMAGNIEPEDLVADEENTALDDFQEPDS